MQPHTIDFIDCSTRVRQTLTKPLSDVDMTSRASMVMNAMGLSFIGDLAQLSHQQLEEEAGVRRKIIFELEDLLRDHGLTFGMVIENWPTCDELNWVLEAPPSSDSHSAQRGAWQQQSRYTRQVLS